MVKAASEGLGLKAMTMDYNMPLSPWMFDDATAAIRVAQRRLGQIQAFGDLEHLVARFGSGQANRVVQGARAGKSGRLDDEARRPRDPDPAPLIAQMFLGLYFD